jgi:hypothetical protein
MELSSATLLPFAFVTALTFAATPAGAVDGAVLITQAKANAGGVTPGDAPGFPVTITAGGSYSLASNLQVPAGLTGILVTGVEVTIDLNGFRITGGGGGSGSGIIGKQRGLTVHNGTIRAFTGDGIFSAGAMLIVSDMRIEENGIGIRANTTANRINKSTVYGNRGVGIWCGIACLVADNVVAANSGFGVLVGNGSTILGNSVTANSGSGLAAETSGVVPATAGYGNNTIIGNGGNSLYGNMISLNPNVCNSVNC